VNKAPGKPLDPLPLEFLKLVMSKEGQEVVVKDGYMPLTAALVKEELGKIKGTKGTNSGPFLNKQPPNTPADGSSRRLRRPRRTVRQAWTEATALPTTRV